MSTTGATNPTTGTNSAADSAATANALTTLAGNFTDFLSLLTTQLQNQDPSSPMDTNQFTSELVQFTGVEEQINTNTTLTSLIQATQGDEVIQGTNLVGKPVSVTSNQISLQDSTAGAAFTTASAEPTTIKITDANGNDILDVSATSKAGSNTWTWNGTNNAGKTVPDGVYNTAVTGTASGASSATAIPFTVNGTATGVANNNGSVVLNLGALAVPFSDVVGVDNAAGSGGSGGSSN